MKLKHSISNSFLLLCIICIYGCSCSNSNNNPTSSITPKDSTETIEDLDLTPINKDGYTMHIAPNPSVDFIKIYTSSTHTSTATFTIYSIDDDEILTTTMDIEKHEELYFEWRETSILETGVYTIEMKIDDDQKVIIKLYFISRSQTDSV